MTCIAKQSKISTTLQTLSELSKPHLPGINRQVSVVERPIERLGRDGLVRRVVVWSQILVCERLSGVDTSARVEDEHLLEKVEG